MTFYLNSCRTKKLLGGLTKKRTRKGYERGNWFNWKEWQIVIELVNT